MCYGENGTVKFFETLADNVFKHSYPMMQIKKKTNEQWDKLGLAQAYTLKLANGIPTLPLGTCISNSKICTYKQTIDTLNIYSLLSKRPHGLLRSRVNEY
jgi:hypothetical protein